MREFKINNYSNHFLSTFSMFEEDYRKYHEEVKELYEHGIDLKKITNNRMKAFEDLLCYIKETKIDNIEEFVEVVANAMQKIKESYLKYLNEDMGYFYKKGIEMANYRDLDLLFFEKFFPELLRINSEEYSWWLYEPDVLSVKSKVTGEDVLKHYIFKEKEYDVCKAIDFLRFNVFTIS